ncbi:Fibroblast growth factor receptor 3 [Stylophora pistillata]|uniref:Fibroblast growth factor receptor 3 n=1 Tax=Stylophora pistillata TaxID=50429 RepID=A0A2B4RKM5_STYPI|nr:Fibroblast growth factor receptor 3 [Stylophora pistillata]
MSLFQTSIVLWLALIAILRGVSGEAEAFLNFITRPSNPTYVTNGSTVKLVWDYSDPDNELQGIVFSVLNGTRFKGMLLKQHRVVKIHSSLSAAYQGRVRIEGKATLVIERITPEDNTFFKCAIFGDSDQESVVQLIVADAAITGTLPFPQHGSLAIGDSSLRTKVKEVDRRSPKLRLEWDVTLSGETLIHVSWMIEILSLSNSERYQIMMKCWQNDPDARPTFTELRNHLKEMETLHKYEENTLELDIVLEANVHFTVTPSDPTYVNNGSTAKLAWDYSDPNNDLYGIVFSVLVKRGGFKRMLYQENGLVKEHQSLPSAYKGRVRMEGRATLVIEKITPKDNTEFRCILFDGITYPESDIRLIVAEADVKFTKRPSNPTYVKNGSTAKLVWDYIDPNNDFGGIAFSVLVDGNRGKEFKRMVYKQYGVIANHSSIPAAYQGRVRMEGNATLVIEKITPKDNTRFRCEIIGRFRSESDIQLIVAEAYVKFTVKPSNPTYVNNGSTAKLVWDYSDPNNDLRGIIFNVLLDGKQFKGMLVKLNGIVLNHSELSSAYKGRVRIEGNATLVIDKITPKDNTEFSCTLVSNSGGRMRDAIQLIVAVCQIHFTSTYDNKVTGIVGGSVNFTWTFTGKVRSVALERGHKVLIVVDSKLQVTVLSSPFSGRINVMWDGRSPGQVTFLLNVSGVVDKGTFRCRLRPQALDDVVASSTVILIVFVQLEADVKFTKRPSSPTYVKNGCTAKLVWDYIDPNNDFVGIVFRVLVDVNRGREFKEILYKQHGVIGNHSSIPAAHHGRVKMEGNATLVIAKITPKDNTEFKCEIFGRLSKRSIIQLSVAEPPKISLSSVQGIYREGSFVNVNCTASGVPEPAITWIRDGKVIRSGKGAALLKFNSLRRTDEGWYLCIANNTADTITNHTVLLVYYPLTIEHVITSSSYSNIGQTVTLKCLSDGVPTPILTWYKPNGMEIHRIRARENIAQVTLRENQDFGDYKCIAPNGLSPSDDRILKVAQIKKPGTPSIVSSEESIQASSLTVRWTAPADNGGSPIKGYMVIILKGDAEMKSVNITDPGKTSYAFGGLERDTNYAVKVFARNVMFEGDTVVTTVKTKSEGPPAAVGIYGLPRETADDEITLKWKEPEDNGREITLYTVYQRIVTDGKVGEWTVLRKIKEVSINKLTVNLERGKVYEFTITATNELGESLVEETMVKRVKVVDLQNNNQRGDFAQHPAVYMDKKETSLDDTRTQAAGQVADYAPLHPSTRSWEVSRNHVTIEKIIGKGAFGQVAKGTATDLRGRAGRTTIAIKMLKDDASELDTKDLVNELETMKQLKPHPHVIKLLGCVTETEPLLVLIEYVPFGDLLGYLRKSRGLNDTYFKDPGIKPRTNLTSQQLMKFAWQIADGMSYLSSKSKGTPPTEEDWDLDPAVAAKVLAKKKNWSAPGPDRLANFWWKRAVFLHVGVATVFQAISSIDGDYLLWFSEWKTSLIPKPGKFTSDNQRPITCLNTVYKWYTSCLLVPTDKHLDGGSPYPRMDGKKVAKLLQQDYRMPKPQHVDDELYQIMMRCWQNDPDVRPTFTELRNQFKDIETKHKRFINMKMYDRQLYANVEDLNV